jgi:hypothetical protein
VLTEPTMDKIRALGLTALAAAWAEQQKDADLQKLTFDERLGLFVDAEWLHLENKRLARLLRAAKLKIGSDCVEGIDYPARRELEKSVIRQLATCRRRASRSAVGTTTAGRRGSIAAVAPHRTVARSFSYLATALSLPGDRK